jgi:hypothetical protein
MVIGELYATARQRHVTLIPVGVTSDGGIRAALDTRALDHAQGVE